MKSKAPLLPIAVVCIVTTSLCYGVGMFVIAGYLPPPSPIQSELEIAAMYQENHVSIITGLTLAFVGAGFMLPLYLMGSVFMVEVEEGFPYLSVLQALCALATVLLTAFPNLIWLTAAFRIDRPSELIYLLHDLGWIIWATPSWAFAFQLICFSACGLRDKRQVPFVPRWFCFLGLWVAVGVLPTPLVPFFVDGGVFSWNGLFSFWIAFFSPVFWFVLLGVMVVNNLNRAQSTRKSCLE